MHELFPIASSDEVPSSITCKKIFLTTKYLKGCLPVQAWGRTEKKAKGSRPQDKTGTCSSWHCLPTRASHRARARMWPAGFNPLLLHPLRLSIRAPPLLPRASGKGGRLSAHAARARHAWARVRTSRIRVRTFGSCDCRPPPLLRQAICAHFASIMTLLHFAGAHVMRPPVLEDQYHHRGEARVTRVTEASSRRGG